MFIATFLKEFPYFLMQCLNAFISFYKFYANKITKLHKKKFKAEMKLFQWWSFEKLLSNIICLSKNKRKTLKNTEHKKAQ